MGSSVRAPERGSDHASLPAPGMLHRFPNDPAYRLSGCDTPQPGDIAYCGIVKKSAPNPSLNHAPFDCVVCADILRRKRGS